MFLGVDFEFAKIVKGGRRAKLDSELLVLYRLHPAKTACRLRFRSSKAFGISSPCRTSRQRTPHIRLDRRPFGLVRTASYLKYKDSKSPGSAKFICDGSEIILSGADFPAKLRAEWAFRRVADGVFAGRGLCRETIRDTLFRAIMYLLRGIMYGMRETIS